MMNIAQTGSKKLLILSPKIELLTSVCKTKLTKEFHLFVRDIILSAKCYLVGLLFVFLGTLLCRCFTINFKDNLL